MKLIYEIPDERECGVSSYGIELFHAAVQQLVGLGGEPPEPPDDVGLDWLVEPPTWVKVDWGPYCAGWHTGVFDADCDELAPAVRLVWAALGSGRLVRYEGDAAGALGYCLGYQHATGRNVLDE